MKRLAKNDWLTPETQASGHRQTQCHQALYRYPQELPERYKDKVVDETAEECSAFGAWKSSTAGEAWRTKNETKTRCA